MRGKIVSSYSLGSGFLGGVWWDGSSKDFLLGEHWAALTREKVPSHPPPNEMLLSLWNTQQPGGMGQDTFKAMGVRFSPKAWQALSVLSQRIGGARGVLFPFVTF